MPITKINITNFKSFDHLEIDLRNFNVLIGANASGKSNFVKIFEFLRDIQNHGLENAVSLQGGVEYLRNMNLEASQNLSLVIAFDSDEKFGVLGRETKKGYIAIRISETIYEFSLAFKGKKTYEIARDELNLKCHFVKLEEYHGKIKEKEVIGEGEIIVQRKNGKLKTEIRKPENVDLKEDSLFPSFLKEQKFPENTLLIETPFYFFPMPERVFGEIGIYDFDPKLPKKATQITGKAELEEDGSNLSIVLKSVIDNRERKRRLSNFLIDLLPFISDLDIEKFADKSLLFKLRESFCQKKYLPASLISDGTINLIALLMALYFEKKAVTIIEEPERNIHPYLIARVVDMMKDASKNKQIIVTTHNPEIVKNADPDNILLVQRDSKGFSRISRPETKEDVQIFLKNEIGIDELFVQGLLEIQ
jgi:predicted ATPase